MRFRLLASLAGSLLVASFANCTDDDSPTPGPVDASTDLGLGVDSARADGAIPEAGVAVDGAVDVEVEAATSDAASDAGGDATLDAALDAAVDAAVDVAVDAGADTGPAFDDAGCPLPTGVVGNVGDAGFPTTGLALWLRADLGVAALDGGAVCRWDDVSGNGRAFLPADKAKPPTVGLATLKGKAAVSFATAGHHMYRTDVLGIAATSGRTVAVFGANADTTRRFQFFHQGKVGTAGTYFGLDANTFQTVGSRDGVYVTNNAYDSNVATSTNPRSHILSISSFAAGGALPGVLTYSVDGAAATLTRTAGGLGNGKVESFVPADITYFGSAVAGHLGAQLGEMLVYDRELTALERTAVEQYFNARFP